ncbi:MAG TPA: transketolase [Aquifex aeolicus]|nr:transketolase [Aquifex aeolicus]
MPQLLKTKNEIDELVVNTIRFLSVDMVERAKSGHPGMPLGASHIVYLLYDRVMKYNPQNPKWFNRDRFILSAGHGCAMLYTALYLFGFDVTLEDLKAFRQLNSKTPGHPEYRLTPGVEATTGNLGQGFGNAVGIAIAEKFLSHYFNRKGFPIIDHYTYVLVSDGDLMEGVSYEVAALAGHFKLNKLIAIWDNNHITIDGDTKLAWSEDVLKRFESLGWEVFHLEDGYNLDLLEEIINKAKESEKPTFISVRTHIGYGTPLQDTADIHGKPMGKEVVIEAKKNLGWPLEDFFVSEEVLKYTRRKLEEGKKLEEEWNRLYEEYKNNYPELAETLEKVLNKDWSLDWLKEIEEFKEDMPTRKASGKILNVIADYIPTMIGGSADLSESVNTVLKKYGDFKAYTPTGRNIHYGVREHAMGTILNGMAYHEGILPYGGTFLIFSEYMKPAIRTAAISGLQVIFVFSHDSIGLGEDGPTHQPIEQIWNLRNIPNLWVIRPADANEVKYAWEIAIKRKEGPTVIILTRQKVKTIDRVKYASPEGVRKGAYVIAEAEGKPDVILIATGSEVQVALEAKEILESKGIKTRVVNMVCCELFESQSDEYKKSVLPPDITKRVAIESGIDTGWYKYVGMDGIVIGLNTFGKSAPGNVLFEYFGFTPENVANKVIEKWFNKDII